MAAERTRQELIRTTILSVVDQKPYQTGVVDPIIERYSALEFESYPNFDGLQIASLDLDSFQLKEIDNQHIPNLQTQFSILWANMSKEIEEGKLTDELDKDRSKVGFLYFSTLSILEVAKRRGKAPINLAAVYRAVDPIFTDKFRGAFHDLSQEEKLDVFGNSFRHTYKLVNQHGFTVIGKK